MYADDVMLLGSQVAALNNKLNLWREVLEIKDVTISREKTE